MTINPTANLLPSTVYTVVITGGTCAPLQREFARAGLHVRRLQRRRGASRPGLPNPAPTVIATNPAANAVERHQRAAVITATFSEDVQGVTSTTVTIARTGGGVIAATVSMEPHHTCGDHHAGREPAGEHELHCHLAWRCYGHPGLDQPAARDEDLELHDWCVSSNSGLGWGRKASPQPDGTTSG